MSDSDTIEADIIRQREQLARTIDALSEKLDVKARVEHKAAHLKDVATTDAGRPRPALLLGAGGALTALVLLAWWRHRG
jgi:hypothetical protein